MRTLTTTILGALLLVSAGCSTSSSDAGAACADVLSPGRPVDDVLADLDDSDGSCVDDDGDPVLLGSASWECPDSTEVHQIGGYGWGRDGDVWHDPADPMPFADCTMP